MRIEVARGDFDAAIATAKTMFALARHLGDYPASAANMLGIDIADQALAGLEEMIQQPGCPNLYWAVTDLPVPIVELRRGFQGDRVAIDAALESIRGDSAMTGEEIEAVVSELSGRLAYPREQSGRPPRGIRDEIRKLTADTGHLGKARARLIDGAREKDAIAKVEALQVLGFPATQIILLDEKLGFERDRDALLTLLQLPAPQVEKLAAKAKTVDGLFSDFLPGVVEARRWQVRLEQRLAMLRHVEALRLHAAEHGGRLPRSLDAVAVPLPDDPFTGKPFAYAVEGTTARLIGSPPRGEENSTFARRYEISLKSQRGSKDE
jgi:hypothetical protein